MNAIPDIPPAAVRIAAADAAVAHLATPRPPTGDPGDPAFRTFNGIDAANSPTLVAAFAWATALRPAG